MKSALGCLCGSAIILLVMNGIIFQHINNQYYREMMLNDMFELNKGNEITQRWKTMAQECQLDEVVQALERIEHLQSLPSHSNPFSMDQWKINREIIDLRRKMIDPINECIEKLAIRFKNKQILQFLKEGKVTMEDIDKLVIDSYNNDNDGSCNVIKQTYVPPSI